MTTLQLKKFEFEIETARLRSQICNNIRSSEFNPKKEPSLAPNNTTLKVVSKPTDWVEKSGTLMAWAVTAQTRTATYIGSLTREQTGLKCDCVCPACGGLLQAVNAGRPLEYFLQGNTHRASFRHHTGQQTLGCLVRVAQLAALQLLFSQNEIDLPAPRARRSVMGASGNIYRFEAIGERQRARIVERYWIDEQEARITLDDGRVVLIRLSGSPNQSDDGSLDAVITIKIDDPEVSNWPPSKILEKAELVNDWLCWDRHWQDVELSDKAQAEAEDDAEAHLDLVPDDLILPEGMTPLQRSESVLHWVIKDMLAKAGAIRAPEYNEVLSKIMPNGREAHREVKLPAMQLKLTNVRVEFGLTGMIPDIMCRAQEANGKSEAFDLMIEVAVTHRVDNVKKQLIEVQGFACLELDVGLLNRSGRVSIDELRAMVCVNPSNKVWINHPEIQRRRSVAHTELLQLGVQIQREQEAYERKNKWFAGLTDAEGLEEYFALVRQRWSDQKTVAGVGSAWDLYEMAAQLSARGYTGLTEDVFWPKGALLWKLEALRESCIEKRSAPVAFRISRESLVSFDESQRYISLILIAIRAYGAEILPDEVQEFEQLKTKVLVSLKNDEIKYARPKTYDAAISLLFPELKVGISKEIGTTTYAKKLGWNKQNELTRIKQEEAERIAAEEAARTARVREMEQAELVRAAIDVFGVRVTWMGMAGWPADVEQAIKLVQELENRYKRSNGMRPSEVIQSAWSARDAKTPIATWLASLNLANEADIPWIIRILNMACLIYER